MRRRWMSKPSTTAAGRRRGAARRRLRGAAPPRRADAWTTLATGETIGRRRYLDLPAAPRGGTLRLRAEASLDTPCIASFRALRLLPEASAGRGRTPARGCAADGVDCVRLRIDTSGRNI